MVQVGGLRPNGAPNDRASHHQAIPLPLQADAFWKSLEWEDAMRKARAQRRRANPRQRKGGGRGQGTLADGQADIVAGPAEVSEMAGDVADDPDGGDLLHALSPSSDDAAGEHEQQAEGDADGGNPFGIPGLPDNVGDESSMGSPGSHGNASSSSSSGSSSGSSSASSGDSSSSDNDESDDSEHRLSLEVEVPGTDLVGMIHHAHIWVSTRSICRLPVQSPAWQVCSDSNSEGVGIQGQGRPLGLLAAWLPGANQHGTKADHMKFRPSYQERVDARAELSRQDRARHFFGKERPCHPGVPEEPVDVV